MRGRACASVISGVTFYEWFWGQTREPMRSECWEWVGSRWPSGYGAVFVPDHLPWLRGRRVKGQDSAHRVAWRLVRGEIPAGLRVLHHCDNPPCVRPSHLYVGTAADNTRDMLSRGRARHAPTKTLLQPEVA